MAIFKQNYTLKLLIAFKMAYYCFSLGGYKVILFKIVRIVVKNFQKLPNLDVLFTIYLLQQYSPKPTVYCAEKCLKTSKKRPRLEHTRTVCLHFISKGGLTLKFFQFGQMGQISFSILCSILQFSDKIEKIYSMYNL